MTEDYDVGWGKPPQHSRLRGVAFENLTSEFRAFIDARYEHLSLPKTSIQLRPPDWRRRRIRA
jgi:hypothetical protein